MPDKYANALDFLPPVKQKHFTFVKMWPFVYVNTLLCVLIGNWHSWPLVSSGAVGYYYPKATVPLSQRAEPLCSCRLLGCLCTWGGSLVHKTQYSRIQKTKQKLPGFPNGELEFLLRIRNKHSLLSCQMLLEPTWKAGSESRVASLNTLTSDLSFGLWL